MTPAKATVLAFLVAPVLPAVVLAILSTDLTDGELGPTLGFVFVFYWYALTASILIGGPLFWLVSRYASVSWWSAVPSGLLAGVIVWLLLGGNEPEWSSETTIYSCVGAASALSFWLVWRLGHRAS